MTHSRAINRMVSSDAGYGTARRKFGRGPSGPVVVNNAALDAFRTARTNRASGTCDIVLIGDSWGESTGATTQANGFVPKLVTALEAAFPTSGVPAIGRSTWVPWDYQNGGGSGSLANEHAYTSKTGTWGGFNSGVGNHNGRPTTVGDTITYSFTGDGFAVAYWCQGGFGVLGVKIDGVAQTSIDTAVGTGGQRLSPIYSMSAGTHTVEISWASGTTAPMFHGCMVYHGNQTKGLRIINAHRSAAQSGDKNNMTSWTRDSYEASPSDLGFYSPDLIVANLSLTNDYNNQTALATFQTDTQTLLDRLRFRSTNCPVLLWAGNAPNDQGAKAIPWTSYRDVFAAVAAADPTKTAFVDFSGAIPTAIADTGVNAFWYTDKIHPNDAGHTTLANLLAAVLSS